LQGNKLGEADGNLVQVPPKFDIKDNDGVDLMHLQEKLFSIHNEFTFNGSANEGLGTIKKKIVKLVGSDTGWKKTGKSSCGSTETLPTTSIRCRSRGFQLLLFTGNGYL